MPVNIIEKATSTGLSSDIESLQTSIVNGGGGIIDIRYTLCEINSSVCHAALIWYTGDSVSNPGV